MSELKAVRKCAKISVEYAFAKIGFDTAENELCKVSENFGVLNASGRGHGYLNIINKRFLFRVQREALELWLIDRRKDNWDVGHISELRSSTGETIPRSFVM